jgi:hypothetical protein
MLQKFHYHMLIFFSKVMNVEVLKSNLFKVHSKYV